MKQTDINAFIAFVEELRSAYGPNIGESYFCNIANNAQKVIKDIRGDFIPLKVATTPNGQGDDQ